MPALKQYWMPNRVEVGCDEAGRGCLAGPVFAAAVIIPKGVKLIGLDDSKKMTEKMRNALRIEIESKCKWAVAEVYPKEIDKINILNASILAMQKAMSKLDCHFDHILIDGNRFKPFKDIPYTTIVKGDAKLKSIAAASVLAKTHRDDYMQQLNLQYPEYKWCNNKGYPTQAHRNAIAEFGPNEHHRMSFTLLPLQIKLFE